MRKGIAGTLRELAEPPREGEPLWVGLARELRTERLLSVQQIADMLDKPYRQVYKALHRERVRQTNQASSRRNRARLTAAQLEYRREKAPFCSACGNKLSKPPKTFPAVCRDCRIEQGRKRDERIAQLWLVGLTGKQIGSVLGCSPGSAIARVQDMRKAGVPLPHRPTGRKPSITIEDALQQVGWS